jgi:flavin-dependent dehydrogenase
MSTDVIRIAGAGLSGLSVGICLARSGHRVEIFEKNPDSGHSRHSDWDAVENWTTEEDFLVCLAEWGIQPTFDYRAPVAFEVIDPKGDCYPLRLERPFFYLLKRGLEPGSLEQGLKAQALDCGVTIHYDRTCARGDVDIWAIGARSAGFFLGAGITFRTSHPNIVAGLVDTRIAPKAYAYLVIVDGFATLSIVLTRDFKNARTYLERCLDVFRRHKSLDVQDVRWTSGFGARAGAFGQQVSPPISVGEAAGLQDFLWGFGIRHALHSGYLAARALHEEIDYSQLIESEIHPMVRASIINRILYDRVGNRTYTALIRHFASSRDLASRLRPWYRGTRLHHILWPLVERSYGTNNKTE